MRYAALLLLLVSACALEAQPDSIPLPPAPEGNTEMLEDFLQNTDVEAVEDFNTLFEALDDYRRSPLNLNRATEQDLRDLRLLNDVQIAALLQHRLLTGDLISVYELQAVRGFTPELIRALLPFITVGGALDDYQVSIREMLRDGTNELYLRWSRMLEKQRGFTPPTRPDETRYLGDPNQYYVRFRHAYGTRLSMGFTAEKDRGEEFFRGSNPYGFDFYSAHFALRNYNRTIKALVLGDYAVSFGQGLIMLTGFNYGKTIATVGIKRSGRMLRPYTSVNEAVYLRGAAAQLALPANLELTAFASRAGRDGNTIQPDTTDIEDGLDPEIREISALNLSGLHRTPREIENKNAVTQLNGGASLKWQRNNNHIAVNAVYTRLDKSILSREQSYARYYFSGNQLLNASVDYGIMLRNFHFFGESAFSDNGGIATLNGLILGLDRKADLAILHRYYARDYQTLTGNAFGESTGVRNEHGLYMGLELRPMRSWTLNGYFDVWQHPWLRFNADAPSRGHEYRLRLTYVIRRKLTAIVEFRQKNREINFPNNDTALDFLVDTRLTQARFHIAHQVGKALELRTRLDVGSFDDGSGKLQTGMSVFQDILYRPMGFPLSFTTRFALFDTDGYAVRFYAFENNLLYNFSIPAYYNRGSRFYFNVRYRPVRALTIEGRIAQTYWANQKVFGSGLDQIDRPARTQATVQLKLQF